MRNSTASLYVTESSVYLHLLIKLGKAKYLTRFRSHGEFRMGTFQSYRKDENGEVGDPNEGAHEISVHSNVVISKRNAVTNDYDEIGTSDSMVSRHFNQTNENSRIFCMYYAIVKVTDDINLSDIIDKELLERFGYDHVVIISNLEKFHEQLDSYFDHAELPYRRGNVNYVDLENGGNKLSPFEKDSSYSHQNEFRLCVQGIKVKDHYDVVIGSLESISFECGINELDVMSIRLANSSAG